MSKNFSTDDVSYYKQYYNAHGEGSYQMEKVAKTSRVKYICKYLREHLKPGAKVLDVGCGDGTLSQLMPEFEWTGVDINTDKARCNSVTHNLMTVPYPFEDNEFDAAVCSEVLEHLWDMRIVQHEMSRLIKPMGLYLVSTPNFDWLWLQFNNYRDLLYDPMQSHLVEHIRQYNYPVHKKHLEEAGFSVFQYVGCDAHFDPMMQKLRAEFVKFVNEELNSETKIDIFDVDMVLGRAFPKNSHTIMLLARNYAAD